MDFALNSGRMQSILDSAPVQLRVYSPIFDANPGQFVDDVSPTKKSGRRVSNWLRSFNRGPYIGSFDILDDESVLADFFYSRLGYEVRESVAGVLSWDGLIFEMEFTTQGSTRRRSYEKIFNAVKDVFDTGSETAWYTNDESIARYGRREHIEYFSSPQTAAELRAQNILAQNSWPWPRAVGFSQSDMRPRLRVRVCGYSFVANFLFSTITQVGGNSFANASDVVSAVVAECPWLRVAAIKSNTMQIAAYRMTKTRIWDWLTEISELGDANYKPWLSWVDVGRYFRYEPLPLTPRYYWQKGVIADHSGGSNINPWLVRPGVFRDMGSPKTSTEPGSIFLDARDAWVDEVECGAAGVSLRSSGSETDVLERQQQYAISMGEGDADLTD